jgi:hypothetical protein
MTFSGAKAILDEIATKNKMAKDSLRTSKIGVSNTKSLLGSMAVQYASAITEINTAADAEPTNPAWLAAKAEAALMVDDFIELNTIADAMVAALDSFEV